MPEKKDRWKSFVTLPPTVFLALIFVVSGTGKLPGQTEFADYLLKTFWGPWTSFIIARLVPWIELVLGLMLILRILPRIAAASSIPLIFGFILNNSWAIKQGIEKFPECGYCFGIFEEWFGAFTPWQSLYIDFGLLFSALLIVILHPHGFLTVNPWFIKRKYFGVE